MAGKPTASLFSWSLPSGEGDTQQIVQNISDRKIWDAMRENNKGLNLEGFSQKVVFEIKSKE